jgi:nucleotide-binding universal stress UspA family protein
MKPPFLSLTVPIDSSPPSQRGVKFAIELGGDGCVLHFCSVVDAATATFGDAGGAPVDPTPIIDALEDDAHAVCAQALAEAQKAGVSADFEVLFGAPLDSIVRFAASRGSDAIVLGTHGRTGLARAILGSIAEALLCSSDVPVVVVHLDDVASTGPITVGVDGYPPSRAALGTAIELARALEQRLSLVMVTGEADATEVRAGDRILDEAAARVQGADVAFDVAMLEGNVADAILASAVKTGSSMIVAGTHGRHGVGRLMLGSVAAALVERAHVPVTIVRQV